MTSHKLLFNQTNKNHKNVNKAGAVSSSWARLSVFFGAALSRCLCSRSPSLSLSLGPRAFSSLRQSLELDTGVSHHSLANRFTARLRTRSPPRAFPRSPRHTQFISVFGIPRIIQSDQGSNFPSNLFGQVLKQLHI